VNIQVIINVDLEDHLIEKSEILELAHVIAGSYLESGSYVASFGFLTYEVQRGDSSCVVVVSEGFGYHSWLGGVDGNFC